MGGVNKECWGRSSRRCPAGMGRPHRRAGLAPVYFGGAWACLQRCFGALACNSIPGDGPRALPKHCARHSIAGAAEAQLQDSQVRVH